MLAWLKIVLLVLIAPVFILVRHKLKIKDDSIVEEVIEDQLEDQLGLTVDLSPESPDGVPTPLQKAIRQAMKDDL